MNYKNSESRMQGVLEGEAHHALKKTEPQKGDVELEEGEVVVLKLVMRIHFRSWSL